RRPRTPTCQISLRARLGAAWAAPSLARVTLRELRQVAGGSRSRVPELRPSRTRIGSAGGPDLAFARTIDDDESRTPNHSSGRERPHYDRIRAGPSVWRPMRVRS